MIVEIVHQQNVDAVWPAIARKISNCIDRFGNDASAGDLWTMCRAGHVFLVVAHDDDEIKGLSIWRSETWVDGPVLKCLMAAGEDMASWLEEMNETVRELAINCGASSYVWQGREGWKHVFKGKAMTCQTLYRMKV